jgi:hypothetical protein
MRFFFNNQVIVSRLKVASGNLESLINTATVECNIQRLQDSRQVIGDGVLSKSFKIWAPLGVDIKEGDTLTDENGQQYSVQDVYISGFGAMNYQEIIVEKSDGFGSY